jgi:hypothetical protein
MEQLFTTLSHAVEGSAGIAIDGAVRASGKVVGAEDIKTWLQ